jgi:glycosyltransferase involved in cell wall biosynthesis
MGKPVTATGVGGVSELTANCGLVVPPRDSQALARAMLTIVNTPPEARRFLGSQARKRILDQFSIDARANDWERLYRAVVTSRPGSRGNR